MTSKLIPKTFKISREQHDKIYSGIYKEAPGELIRLLIDAFFAGKVHPSVDLKYRLKLSVRRAANGTTATKRSA